MPLLIVAAGVALLLVLMIFFKLNGFIALILVSLGVGMAFGMDLMEVISSIKSGLGDTLGHLALVIGFGAILGKILAESGAAHSITQVLIQLFGRKHIQWAIVITGFIVGFAMFFEVGFVILIPLVFGVAIEAGIPLLYLGIPMAAALSVTHGFLPPHPGPTAISVYFEADIGRTLLYGIILSIPIIIIAGPVFSRWVRNLESSPPEGLFTHKEFKEGEAPGFLISLFTALLPLILMVISAIIKIVMPDTWEEFMWIHFLGDPVIALMVGVLFSFFSLGVFQGRDMTLIGKEVAQAVSGIAMILLIIGGGGAFKQVLVDSGVGDYLTEILSGTQVNPLILTWLIAAVLRISLGSATVAAITTASIALPLVQGTDVSPELMVLSTGAGSLIFSHVNDPGFWMFKEYFNLSVGATFRSWTLMETVISVLGLLGVLLLQMFI